MKRSTTRTLLVGMLALLLTTVCNLPRTGAPTPTSQPSDFLIPPTTKVLDSGFQAAILSVSEDGLIVFSRSNPELEALKPGDVLVSDAGQAAPYGLLRKVRSTRADGDQIVVETEDAQLVEAVHEGHVSLVQDLRQEDIRASWLSPGVTLVRAGAPDHARPLAAASAPDHTSPRPAPISYNIDTDFGTGGRVRAVGNASIEPKLETDLNISCDNKVFGVCAEIPDLNFMTRIALIEDVSLAVKGEATSFNKKLEIARHEFSPITLWMGPVPVVFTPILSVYLQGDGVLTSKVEYAIGQRLTLAAGFKYNSDKGFDNLSEASFDFLKPTPSFDREFDLRGVVGGEFKLLLYGAIGPVANLEAGPRLRASMSGLQSEPGVLWRAEGCIWLFVGIDSVKVIKLRYQKELYKACATFAEGLNQPPLISIRSPNQGTQVYQGEAVKLRASVVDLDGGPVTCQWTSSQSADPFPVTTCENASVKFETAGGRILTLTGTDATGAGASASVSLEVLPPPEILAAIESPPDGGTVGPDETITLSGSASGGNGPYKFKWSIAYPTDAAGSGGTEYEIGSGSSLAWAPSNSITFGGCEVNGYGRLILDAQDSNDYSGQRTIVIAIMRIC